MKLTKNMSRVDRVIRFFALVAIIVLLWAELVVDPLKTILGIIAIILMITVVLDFCPIYALFKISTGKRDTKNIE